MLNLKKIIELIEPGGVYGYTYLNVFEAALYLDGAKSTLNYIENNDNKNKTELEIAYKNYIDAINEYTTIIHLKVKDESLKIKMLSVV